MLCANKVNGKAGPSSAAINAIKPTDLSIEQLLETQKRINYKGPSTHRSDFTGLLKRPVEISGLSVECTIATEAQNR